MKDRQLVLAQAPRVHPGGQFRRIIENIHLSLEQGLIRHDTDLLDELFIGKIVCLHCRL